MVLPEGYWLEVEGLNAFTNACSTKEMAGLDP